MGATESTMKPASESAMEDTTEDMNGMNLITIEEKPKEEIPQEETQMCMKMITQIYIYNENLELVLINDNDKLKQLYTEGKLQVSDVDGSVDNEYTFLNYGIYHEFISENYDEAKKYYLMAIEKGNSYAMSNLGFYYDHNENYDEAKKYYLMAIEKGNPFAMNNLGNHYQFIEKNNVLALEYYYMAMEKGNVQAMLNLGNLFTDNEKKKEYFLMAFEHDKNNTTVLNYLGYYYCKIEKNFTEAKKYFLMAAEQGDIVGMYNLGCYYYFIEKNYEESKKYHLMAAKKGCIGSILCLGIHYENIEKNRDKAIKYYFIAYMNGYLPDIILPKLKKIATPLELYMLFHENKLEYNEEITPEIQLYINKLKLAKVETCYLCKGNDKQVIMLQCFAHECCSYCYIRIYDKPCSICNL